MEARFVIVQEHVGLRVCKNLVGLSVGIRVFGGMFLCGIEISSHLKVRGHCPR
jgi:hypothetical protein